MTEFNPNPFKVNWGKLVEKKIVDVIVQNHEDLLRNSNFLHPSPQELIRHTVKMTIVYYKEEMRRNKELGVEGI